MMNDQIAGLLRNNQGDARMVSRIAQEQGLSQEEIAQALKIPAEAAARYVGGPEMGSRKEMMPFTPEVGTIDGGGSIGGGAGDVARGMNQRGPAIQQIPLAQQQMPNQQSSNAGMSNAAPQKPPMPSNAGFGSPAVMPNAGGVSMGGQQTPMIAEQGIKPAAPPQPMAPAAKPMPSMTKPMMETAVKPGQMTKPIALPSAAGGRQPMGRPNFAGSQRPRMQGNAGEQAFVSAFNRMRGNVQ